MIINTPVLELEGTWEEVAAHAPELMGRRVRLIVIPPPLKTNSSSFREASGRSLLRHAGTWQGDDFEECFNAVVESRGTVQFRDE